MEEKLYDLRAGNYPRHRGAAFRTLQIFVCRECLSQTNLAVVEGSVELPLLARRCPNADESWHWQLEDLYRELDAEIDPQAWVAKLNEICDVKMAHRGEVKQDIIGDACIGFIDPNFVKVARSTWN